MPAHPRPDLSDVVIPVWKARSRMLSRQARRRIGPFFQRVRQVYEMYWGTHAHRAAERLKKKACCFLAASWVQSETAWAEAKQ